MSARGRPRSFDRDQALDAAMRLFWLKGYGATSITELCSAMGIGSPSLYAAFTSKASLYAEAIDRYGQRISPAIWNPLKEGLPARTAVEQFLMKSAQVLTDENTPRGCMVTLSAVADEGHESLGNLVRNIRAAGLRFLEQRLTRAVIEGELPKKADVAILARFYYGVQQGMSIQARDGASPQSLQLVAQAAMLIWPTMSQT